MSLQIVPRDMPVLIVPRVASLSVIGVLIIIALINAGFISGHQVDVDTNTGVGAAVAFTGAYPYPPTTPGVAEIIPPPGAFRLHRQFAHANCAAQLVAYAPTIAGRERGGMLGLVVAEFTNPLGGANVFRSYYGRSGGKAQPTAVPLAIGGVIQGGWEWVTTTDKGSIQTRITNMYATPRRCFGSPPGPWNAPGVQCRVNNDGEGRVRRRYPPPLGGGAAPDEEEGIKAGVCALTVLVDIVRQMPNFVRFGCAAEVSISTVGWTGGKTLAGAPRDYASMEIVSSCVTCQQVVPMLLGATCDVPNLLPGQTLGDCPKNGVQLQDGDTCRLGCSDVAGYEVDPAHANAVTECLNGQIVPNQNAYCRSKCIVGARPLGALNVPTGCQPGHRLAPDAVCSFTCDGNVGLTVNQPQSKCNAGAFQSQTCQCTVPNAPSRANLGGSTCEPGHALAIGESCYFRCENTWASRSRTECTENGLGPAQTCVRTCDVGKKPLPYKLLDANDRSQCKAGLKIWSDQPCSFRCPANHRLSSITSTCDPVTGKIAYQQCIGECQLGQAPANSVRGGTCAGTLDEGATCTYACHEDYALSAPTTTCTFIRGKPVLVKQTCQYSKTKAVVNFAKRNAVTCIGTACALAVGGLYHVTKPSLIEAAQENHQSNSQLPTVTTNTVMQRTRTHRMLGKMVRAHEGVLQENIESDVQKAALVGA